MPVAYTITDTAPIEIAKLCDRVWDKANTREGVSLRYKEARIEAGFCNVHETVELSFYVCDELCGIADIPDFETFLRHVNAVVTVDTMVRSLAEKMSIGIGYMQTRGMDA